MREAPAGCCRGKCLTTGQLRSQHGGASSRSFQGPLPSLPDRPALQSPGSISKGWELSWVLVPALISICRLGLRPLECSVTPIWRVLFRNLKLSLPCGLEPFCIILRYSDPFPKTEGVNHSEEEFIVPLRQPLRGETRECAQIGPEGAPNAGQMPGQRGGTTE